MAKRRAETAAPRILVLFGEPCRDLLRELAHAPECNDGQVRRSLRPQNCRGEVAARFEQRVAGRQRSVAAFPIQKLVLDDECWVRNRGARPGTFPRCAFVHAGQARANPGMPAKCFSMFWLCVGPYPRPPPIGVRMTSGFLTRRLYMPRNFAAWLRIWSKHSPKKSPNMISTTGRRPPSARPFATPTIPASLIGVLITRSGKESDKRRVALKAPP